MDVRNWTVCVIDPNKFERQIIVDLLRNAGADRIQTFENADEAFDALRLYSANVVIAPFELSGTDGAAWTRVFRRNKKLANRKAAVFITSAAFSLAMAEQCRHAGCNALIGKPLSAKVLIATINKVLGKPREFIDAEGYVGPCRRAGIVTAGAPKKRRKADEPGAKQRGAQSLDGAVAQLSIATVALGADTARGEACEAALRQVQAYAVNAGDGPLMRVCAAFALQITATRTQKVEVARKALEACMKGVAELAKDATAAAEQREAVAERVREAVAQAVTRRAA